MATRPNRYTKDDVIKQAISERIGLDALRSRLYELQEVCPNAAQDSLDNAITRVIEARMWLGTVLSDLGSKLPEEYEHKASKEQSRMAPRGESGAIEAEEKTE